MKTIRFKYIIVLFFSINLVPALSMDSLQLSIQYQKLEAATGIEKLKLYDELSWDLRKDNSTKAATLAKEGIELASQLKDSTYYYKLHSNLGGILIIQNILEEGIDQWKGQGQQCLKPLDLHGP